MKAVSVDEDDEWGTDDFDDGAVQFHVKSDPVSVVSQPQRQVTTGVAVTRPTVRLAEDADGDEWDDW
ncbi:hypothetical protein ERJ75_001643300 [Trypanosoma vivax]|nr:hypothetical protein ERJ75_001643300 [Trypanosoma vivax]